MASGWIGVDLDGTLAEYHGFKGPTEIGKPIPEMVDRVKRWLAEDRDVRIFTARVSVPHQKAAATRAIEAWCQEHLGQKLPITNCKDYGMIESWDDRATEVRKNTGEPVNVLKRK